MNVLIVLMILAVLVLAGMFSLASASQSYASARQAQAAIEASQTAQMAVAGNLIVIVILGLLVVILAGVVVILVLRSRSPARQAGPKRWSSGPNALWGQEPGASLPAPDPQGLLLSMMAYQMLQQQQRAMQPPAQVSALQEPEEDWSAVWQDM